MRAVLDMVRAGLLDANVFKALAAVVPAYPPGAIVELNDGSTCVVTKWNPALPCAPTVRMLLPADLKTGEHGLGPAVDLSTKPSLTIRSVDGEDVSADNFHPLFKGEFDLRLLSGGITLDAPVPASEAA
jgi:hypothetical protein